MLFNPIIINILYVITSALRTGRMRMVYGTKVYQGRFDTFSLLAQKESVAVTFYEEGGEILTRIVTLLKWSMFTSFFSYS